MKGRRPSLASEALPTPRVPFRVQGLGFQGLGFRVQGLGVLGFRVWGSGFRVQGLGFSL